MNFVILVMCSVIFVTSGTPLNRRTRDIWAFSWFSGSEEPEEFPSDPESDGHFDYMDPRTNQIYRLYQRVPISEAFSGNFVPSSILYNVPQGQSDAVPWPRRWVLLHQGRAMSQSIDGVPCQQLGSNVGEDRDKVPCLQGHSGWGLLPQGRAVSQSVIDGVPGQELGSNVDEVHNEVPWPQGHPDWELPPQGRAVSQSSMDGVPGQELGSNVGEVHGDGVSGQEIGSTVGAVLGDVDPGQELGSHHGEVHMDKVPDQELDSNIGEVRKNEIPDQEHGLNLGVVLEDRVPSQKLNSNIGEVHADEVPDQEPGSNVREVDENEAPGNEVVPNVETSKVQKSAVKFQQQTSQVGITNAEISKESKHELPENSNVEKVETSERFEVPFKFHPETPGNSNVVEHNLSSDVVNSEVPEKLNPHISWNRNAEEVPQQNLEESQSRQFEPHQNLTFLNYLDGLTHLLPELSEEEKQELRTRTESSKSFLDTLMVSLGFSVKKESADPGEIQGEVPGEDPDQGLGEVQDKVPGGAPDDTPGDVLGGVPVTVLGEVPGKVLDGVRVKVPGQPRVRVPAKVLGEVPIEALGEVPANGLSEVPGEFLGGVPVRVPAKVMGKVPDKVLGGVSDKVFGGVPSKVPDEVLSEVPVSKQKILSSRIPKISIIYRPLDNNASDAPSQPLAQTPVDTLTTSEHHSAVPSNGNHLPIPQEQELQARKNVNELQKRRDDIDISAIGSYLKTQKVTPTEISGQNNSYAVVSYSMLRERSSALQ